MSIWHIIGYSMFASAWGILFVKAILKPNDEPPEERHSGDW